LVGKTETAATDFVGKVIQIKQGLFSWSNQEFTRTIEVLNTVEVRQRYINCLKANEEGLSQVEAEAQADTGIRQGLEAMVHSASHYAVDKHLDATLRQFSSSKNIEHTRDATTLHFPSVDAAVVFYKYYLSHVENQPRSIVNSGGLISGNHYFTIQPAPCPHVLRHPVPAHETCVLAVMNRSSHDSNAVLVNTLDQQAAAMVILRQVCSSNDMPGEPLRLDLLHSLPNRQVKVCIVFKEESSVSRTGQLEWAFKTYAWVTQLVKPASNPQARYRPDANEVPKVLDERLRKLYMGDRAVPQLISQSAAPKSSDCPLALVNEPASLAVASTVAQTALSPMSPANAVVINVRSAGIEVAREVINDEAKDAKLEITQDMTGWLDMCMSVMVAPEGTNNLTQLLADDIGSFHTCDGAQHMTLVQVCYIYQSAIHRAISEEHLKIDTSKVDPSLVLWEVAVEEARILLSEQEHKQLSLASKRRREAGKNNRIDGIAEASINTVVPKISAVLLSKLMLSQASADILAMEVARSFHSTVTQPQDGGAAKK
jgi:hypothetical protein